MSLPVSPLFVPGDRPERFAKAEASGADAVILDLEDAVDATMKDAARGHVVAHAGAPDVPLMVRVNGAGTDWWADDLRAVGELLLLLPDVQQQVIRLRVYDGLKFREVAEVLGCPVNTALARMHDGLTRLRSLWEAQHG